MTNLDSILKSRDITLQTKVHLVKTTVFPVGMYWCESWTINQVDGWKTGAFTLWCWRRLVRVPWASRRSNQLLPKEINPEYSLEGLMLKLKLHCFGHLMQRVYSLEETLMLGKIEGGSRRRWQRMRWLNDVQFNGHKFEQTLGDGTGQGSLVCCNPWGHRELNTTEWYGNNIEATAVVMKAKYSLIWVITLLDLYQTQDGWHYHPPVYRKTSKYKVTWRLIK